MAGHSYHGKSRRLSERDSIDLTSKKIYDLMEIDNNDLSEYDIKCDNIFVPGNNKDKVKTICKKFLRYLEKSTVWDFVNPEYDVCLLLNYWVYDKLTHIFPDKYDKNIAFGNFQTLFRNNTENPRSKSHNKNCTHKFNILDKDDWEKRKELYDYYIDYKTVKPTITYYVPQCKGFYKYTQEKKDLYEYFENLCKSNPTECPDFYENCKDFKPDLVLPNFPCHIQMEGVKGALAPEETSEDGLDDGPRPYGLDLSEHGARSSEAGMTQKNSDIGTNVGKSVLGIAPIALTASALYKFTPLGPWIRKLATSNHNITGNIDGDNEFLDHTQESGTMFFDSGENYISYQPM
ncbi:PIR Superfamily Protein [Plasmodium ovale wallikeri]|uniref:PIR protein n=2 Tax=Plasmodium ovale TaxID=36330 RepID=A0A1C3KIT3_PLAOA|nr:PIR Superfamily Protein [Plasmodium ovale wallikeri]SBT73708.1 PIR protein [Plasmodium ovale]